LVMVASLSAPPPPSSATDPGAQSPATQSPPSTQPKRKQRVGWRQGDQHDAPDETPHGEDDSDSPKKPAVPTVHQPPPPQRRRPFRPPSLVRPPTAAAVPTPAPPPPPPQQEKARPSEARLFDLPWAGSTVVVRPAQAQQPPAAEPIVPGTALLSLSPTHPLVIYRGIGVVRIVVVAECAVETGSRGERLSTATTTATGAAAAQVGVVTVRRRDSRAGTWRRRRRPDVVRAQQ